MVKLHRRKVVKIKRRKVVNLAGVSKMDNKLFKLLEKTQKKLFNIIGNMLNINNELLDKVYDKSDNGEYIEDKNHWNNLLLEIDKLAELVYKLESRALAITSESEIQIINRFLVDDFMDEYETLCDIEEKHIKSEDARTNCLNRSVFFFSYILEIVQNTEKQIGISIEPSKQLNTNLNKTQIALLFDLLVEGGFITDENKDGFIWAFGGKNDKYTFFKKTWLVDAVFLTDLLREIKKDEITLEEMKVRAKLFFVNKKGGKVKIDSYKKKNEHPNYKKLMKIINTVQNQ